MSNSEVSSHVGSNSKKSPTKKTKNDSGDKLGIFSKLRYRLILFILLLFILAYAISFYLIRFEARPNIAKVSEEVVINKGEKAINGIVSTLMLVDGFAQSLGKVSEVMPHNDTLLTNAYSNASTSLPVDAIGGGFWFEPNAFELGVDRKAKYWYRDNDKFVFTEDYENPSIVPDPYYNDWWYVPSLFAKTQKDCVWSRPYVDPVSGVLMLTCTRPLLEETTKAVRGTVTVDLDLAGLKKVINEWQKETGGYAFLVDQGNNFITFPDEKMVKKPSELNKEGDYISLSEFAKTHPEYKMLTDKLISTRSQFINDAKAIDPKRFDAIVSGITARTKKLTLSEAEDQAASILYKESGKSEASKNSFSFSMDMENDFLLKEASTAYVFELPQTYWKLVIVKPKSEIVAVSDGLASKLNLYYLVAFILMGLLAFFIIQQIFGRPMAKAVESVQKLTQLVGKRRFSELEKNKLADVSQSEIGLIGQSMNNLVDTLVDTNQQLEKEVADRTTAQKKAEDENENLNNSVIAILQSVHQLSERDLTARAPVTEDVIGTVSDSINLLTDETTRVLKDVTNVAGQVKNSSEKVRSQAELVSKTAADERQSVNSMMEALLEATQSMNRVAALTEESNKAASEATQVTDNALETVTGTVRGMESIRDTIAETEKRIKRLGERSQEISGIVNLINTISERTHVLALNASMQAAVAGEAGRGFAVVAEEVQRLAESSRNATQQIASLVNNIQIETNETISTVNNTISQVVDGSEQAQKAGEQMRQTQEITAQLVSQVRSIALASEQQKAMSAELLTAVQRIGESTEQTAQQIDAQNQETAGLQQAAQQLVESVGVFKLPEA